MLEDNVVVWTSNDAFTVGAAVPQMLEGEWSRSSAAPKIDSRSNAAHVYVASVIECAASDSG